MVLSNSVVIKKVFSKRFNIVLFIEVMSKLENIRILIVGAGIAGSALFRRLKAQRHQVDIIEKSPTLTNEGAAICLPANAMIELKKLDLVDQVMACAHQVEQIEYALSNGKTLAKASLNDAPLNKAPFVALKRDALMNILRKDIAKEITLDTCLTDIDHTDEGATVTFNNGHSQHYDLVVAADGINSQVREIIQPDTPLLKHTVTNWRFITQKPSQDFQPVYYVGNTSLFMIYPISNEEVYCYGHVIDPTGQYYAMPVKTALNAIFANYAAPIKHCLDNMPDNKDIVRGGLKSVAKTESVYNNVVLIGDALHGCPPSLQQGAGMSLEDVNCLAEQLADNTLDLQQVLANYQQARSARVAWTVQESNKIIKLARLGQSFIGRLVRNFIIRRTGPANVVGWRKLLAEKI
ncbi:monooxygenase [Pseudoalteromonas aurantia]|uniref:Monooxygenase n=2 Tax=Pseudoalteromonas aurantia TaxID=43654 RepID=A0A5S3VA34_9GAMM|nr:monooxygenase [Pseudoalteromonas aurantia]